MWSIFEYIIELFAKIAVEFTLYVRHHLYLLKHSKYQAYYPSDYSRYKIAGDRKILDSSEYAMIEPDPT